MAYISNSSGANQGWTKSWAIRLLEGLCMAIGIVGSIILLRLLAVVALESIRLAGDYSATDMYENVCVIVALLLSWIPALICVWLAYRMIYDARKQGTPFTAKQPLRLNWLAGMMIPLWLGKLFEANKLFLANAMNAHLFGGTPAPVFTFSFDYIVPAIVLLCLARVFAYGIELQQYRGYPEVEAGAVSSDDAGAEKVQNRTLRSHTA